MKNKLHHLNLEVRKNHNQELIKRMKAGESLSRYDNAASWYPPRPIIKKDTKEMARVYGVSEDPETIKEVQLDKIG